jgi:asparagine synthase (glutamine-hydrolysing)
MGGIAGIVHFDGTQPNGARAEAMAHALEHRGPDGLGIWQSEQAVVTHRRRCVVPGRSPQPVVTDEAVLSMDGWLFDHERLALSMGVDPTGRSDVYSLLAAWQRYGAELGRHVEGEYAVAVWNQAAGVLTLLRDRMGTRPLYWCRVGGKVAFASDIPALLEASSPARCAGMPSPSTCRS